MLLTKVKGKGQFKSTDQTVNDTGYRTGNDCIEKTFSI